MEKKPSLIKFSSNTFLVESILRKNGGDLGLCFIESTSNISNVDCEKPSRSWHRLHGWNRERGR